MSGALALVTAAGRAGGSKAAAAALACAGSEPDRAGLLVDVGGAPPRPTLLSSPGARELEERLALHRPDLAAASRGQTCHLVLGEETLAPDLRTVLPLVRDSIAVVHLPPGALRGALDIAEGRPIGVLLRADLARDRALVALAVADLIARGLVVKVQRRPLAWIPARRALFGVLPPGSSNLEDLLNRSRVPVFTAT